MLPRVALVRTVVSEERSVSIIRVTRIGELGTALAVTSNRSTLRRYTVIVPSSPMLVILMMGALISTETSLLTRTTWRNIPEDAITLPLLWLKSIWFTQPSIQYVRRLFPFRWSGRDVKHYLTASRAEAKATCTLAFVPTCIFMVSCLISWARGQPYSLIRSHVMSFISICSWSKHKMNSARHRGNFTFQLFPRMQWILCVRQVKQSPPFTWCTVLQYFNTAKTMSRH
jgi:hypothetical protein